MVCSTMEMPVKLSRAREHHASSSEPDDVGDEIRRFSIDSCAPTRPPRCRASADKRRRQRTVLGLLSRTPSRSGPTEREEWRRHREQP